MSRIGKKNSRSFGSDCGDTEENTVDRRHREGQVSAQLQSVGLVSW
jgi:hypothetical protein